VRQHRGGGGVVNDRTVTQYFPAIPATGVEEFLAGLARPPAAGLVVGDARIRAFLESLGRGLLSAPVARRHPELAPLGFFLRPAALDRTLQGTDSPAGHHRSPRGMVLHIPPSNVDTIFGYSWALSALAGNTNVVRVSSRAGQAAWTLIKLIGEVAGHADPVVARTQRLIGYVRDDTVTARLSQACDLRVIWGGDEAIRHVRTIPLPAASRDLTFPDRSSFTAISAEGWLNASSSVRDRAVRDFYNDTYWFDQAACSSPRAVFWIGEDDLCQAARHDFYALLRQVVGERGPSVDASMAVEKRVATYGLAADGTVNTIRFAGNALATATLAAPDLMPRRWLGIGTLLDGRASRLSDLVPMICRRDQTLTYFGFGRETLIAFARALGGRGVDRIVPIGSALEFTSTWDGYDLMREFTRLTTIVA
jgi:hypothetical protein